ncbi:MAG TPA: hypothetical protein VK850_16085 [Candidatus Binatia bacterium]|nr:hypothetical protein [Candidatus Binatia bacterium]
MKFRVMIGWSSALWLSAILAQGQETNELQQLRRQLQEIQKRLDALERQQSLPAMAPPPGAPAEPATRPTESWTPTQPMRIGNAQNYINLSFDALMAAGWSTAEDVESLQTGGHDPKERGFTLQNLETVFEGKVDPYFRAQANIVLQIDPEGETTIEAEEAYLETMSLPWNLQLKAGQFLTEFGRLNPTHPHTWDFVDQPLVNGRFFGEDGLRNPGARISWLMPTPFYSELFFAVQNSQGETAHSFRDDHDNEPFFGRRVEQGRVKSLGDLLFAPRYAVSFDLSESQTLLTGASAAFGPNGTGGDTQIYGVDMFWKWKPVNHHSGFPFVTWQNEAMIRRFEADAFPGDGTIPALPGETLTDYGFYSQVSYGYRKGWVASLRGDYVNKMETGDYERIVGIDPNRDRRWRISPALTWYPSEFSKIRLQYNYDDRAHIGEDHSIWMQFEFLLGTHAAHKF